MALAISESGTWGELLELAGSLRGPIDLVGQGKVSGGGVAFSCRACTVRTDLRSAEELAAARRLWSFRHNPEQPAEQTPLSVCICSARGWLRSFLWPWLGTPTAAALPLYRALASGLSMDDALLFVRREIAVASDPFPVPVL